MAFKKYFKNEEPTPVDLVEPETNHAESGDMDIEKARPSYEEGHIQAQEHHIDPEVEKRVVRKLDMHVVPLVMALCMLTLFKHVGFH